MNHHPGKSCMKCACFILMICSSFNSSQTVILPIQALKDYLPTDVLQVNVYQKQTTLVRNYLYTDCETSIRLVMAKQYADPLCFEFLALKSELGPTYPLQINKADLVVFSDTPRLLGCTAFNTSDHRTIRGKIMLLSRGSCQFEEKIWHAQQAGAKGVILMNNVDGPLFKASGSKTRNIKIPSVLMSKQDSLVLMRHAHTLQSFSMKQLPLDKQATYKLLFLGAKVKNLVLV